MTKVIEYSKATSWTLIENDLFVFENVYDQAFIFRGLKKDLWFLIGKKRNYKVIMNKLKMIGYDDELITKVLNDFENKKLIFVRNG